MQEICINRLDIKGNKDSILSFLKGFYSEENGFSMCCIVPYGTCINNTWKIINWGTTKDIFESNTYEEVINSFLNNQVTINYLTQDTPNEAFCRKASKVYDDLTFSLSYYEPTSLFAGKTSYKKGEEIESKTEFYEVDNTDKDDSIIRIYDFAIKEGFTTLSDIMEPLSKTSSIVREHFYKQEEVDEENLVLDFNTLKEEYIIESLNVIEGAGYN